MPFNYHNNEEANNWWCFAGLGSLRRENKNNHSCGDDCWRATKIMFFLECIKQNKSCQGHLYIQLQMSELEKKDVQREVFYNLPQVKLKFKTK